MDFITVAIHETLKALFNVAGLLILGVTLAVVVRMVVWNATR
jgi:hypothetical protein